MWVPAPLRGGVSSSTGWSSTHYVVEVTPELLILPGSGITGMTPMPGFVVFCSL